ncbi:MAG TPA: PhnD/SsuA/transferrin family substrate-binding protein [Candidatus Dormibacteraeota bacterium]|nr:PhnD/SsuA/transferrin family substrate-binding protein [Candidatus Dormibacteraeota bacterium]
MTIAIRGYDHVRDALSGAVAIDGVELVHLDLPVEEVFRRFLRGAEWEVSEMSMGAYAALVARGGGSMVAIPVFPSRMFRHSAIFVRADSGLRDAGQLAGRRIGVVDWAQTAAIYVRGALADQFGVRLDAIDWCQGGLSHPAAAGEDMVGAVPPPGVRLSRVTDRSLEDLLLAGDLDAVIATRAPAAANGPDAPVRRLFERPRAVEEAYWRAHGVFPIMHTVVIRRDVHEAHPWLARRLYAGLDAARERSVQRLLDPAAPYFPLPWAREWALDARELLGGDAWAYGLEPNRATLEAFGRYAHEQGVTAHRLAPEELFPPI